MFLAGITFHFYAQNSYSILYEYVDSFGVAIESVHMINGDEQAKIMNEIMLLDNIEHIWDTDEVEQQIINRLESYRIKAKSVIQ